LLTTWKPVQERMSIVIRAPLISGSAMQ